MDPFPTVRLLFSSQMAGSDHFHRVCMDLPMLIASHEENVLLAYPAIIRIERRSSNDWKGRVVPASDRLCSTVHDDQVTELIVLLEPNVT